MSKLVVIDKAEYIMEGEFEKIRTPERTFIDEENVLANVEQFKTDFVDKGLALGELNDGFLVMPTIMEYDGKQVQGEQVVEEEKEPAFMIIDVYWNKERRAICGKLIILDTEDGEKIKEAINHGMECFISASQTELYDVMDDAGRTLCRISNIKGYKISIINFHNTNQTT
jgi:hypothetical protein